MPAHPMLLRGALIATLLAVAGAVRADEQPALRLPFTGEVRAGEMVELAWTGIGADVDEMEILLSIDGGRRSHVRVSPELDPRAGRWRWRVPNLPTADARLTLRVGRRGCEIDAATSEIFRIVGTPGQAPERDLVHEGSWWSGPAPLDRRGPGIAGACEMYDGAGSETQATLPLPPDAAPEDRGTPLDGAALQVISAAAQSIPISRTPRFTPPRE